MRAREDRDGWPADQVERWPIDRLIPYAKNSRTHSEARIAQLAASLKEWGWTNPVLASPPRRVALAGLPQAVLQFGHMALSVPLSGEIVLD